ncbi:MAG: undecaprenyl-diphosphate phosphatase [Alphaproteobacteria bacterium]
MDLFQIIVLALVQGITEFLPISSSGHLVLVPVLTGWKDQGLLMDVAVHVGTLLAVIAYFWRELMQAAWGLVDLLNRRDTDAAKLALALVIASIPAIIAGFILHELKIMDALRSAEIIGWTTLVFGIVLWGADHFGPTGKTFGSLTVSSAIWIGLAQCLALIPGTSRSGITMTAARGLGFNRQDAARFAMLLSIPTIAGAGFLSALDLIESGDAQLTTDALTAAGLSALAAFTAIALFLKWLQKRSMAPFAIYRIALGVGLLSWVYL